MDAVLPQYPSKSQIGVACAQVFPAGGFPTHVGGGPEGPVVAPVVTPPDPPPPASDWNARNSRRSKKITFFIVASLFNSLQMNLFANI